MMVWHRFWWLVVVAACVGTPQPDPPNVDPTVNGDLISLVPPRVRNMHVDLRGAAGAIEPATASLFVYNLDSSSPPAVVQPSPDGSFQVTVTAVGGDELRLFSVLDEQRSAPVDLLITPTGVTAPARPLADCFTVEPAAELLVTVGGTSSVSVSNDCSEAVRVAHVGLRSPLQGLTLGAWPSTLAPGEGFSLELSVELEAFAGEEILLLEVDQPQADRRAITVVVTGVR
jgi:hypothetical protein